MSHKRAKKEGTKVEQKVEEFEKRLKATEEYLGQIFGTEPQVMNFHFLLTELRATNEEAQRLFNRGQMLEAFIMDEKLTEQFEAWRKKKIEALQPPVVPPKCPDGCEEHTHPAKEDGSLHDPPNSQIEVIENENAGSGSPVNPPDP